MTIHKCPFCGEREAIEYAHYDSPPTHTAAVAIAALAGPRRRYTCYPLFSVMLCLNCHKSCYRVDITFINKSRITKEWANPQFWPRTAANNPIFIATIHRSIPRLPDKWFLTRINTPKGLLEQHGFGLFPKPDIADISDDALPLIRTAWPIVTGHTP